MIVGSCIKSEIKDIWACEFIESPSLPSVFNAASPFESGVINQIGYTIDNTTKTRAIFEINKGINQFPKLIDVNNKIPDWQRRIPIENMLYIADGPSDIPAFSVVKSGRGHCLAVYAPGNDASFNQANDLLENGRVHQVGPADYTIKSQTYLWIKSQILKIATRISETKENLLKELNKNPRHLV